MNINHVCLYLKIAASETLKDLQESSNKIADVIDMAGCMSLTVRLEQKDDLVNSLTRFWVMDRMVNALRQ